jgi:hypothetical protein
VTALQIEKFGVKNFDKTSIVLLFTCDSINKFYICLKRKKYMDDKVTMNYERLLE